MARQDALSQTRQTTPLNPKVQGSTPCVSTITPRLRIEFTPGPRQLTNKNLTTFARQPRVVFAAVIVIGLLATSAIAGVGWYFSSQLLTPNHPVPTYDVTVEAVTSSSVELDRTVETNGAPVARQGTFGLEWSGGHAIVGRVIATTARTVTRTLEQATAQLHQGDHVVLTAQVYQGDPTEAFGVPSQNVEIPGELGLMPAWYVPGHLPDFVIVVHGYNGPQTDGLRIVPVLAKLGLPAVLISYRNDPGAPASRDRLLHLGDTEWLDCEAAVRWALAQGAQRIVLVGISMGGAVVQIFMQRSALAGHVAAVILDSRYLTGAQSSVSRLLGATCRTSSSGRPSRSSAFGLGSISLAITRSGTRGLCALRPCCFRTVRRLSCPPTGLRAWRRPDLISLSTTSFPRLATQRSGMSIRVRMNRS